MNWPNILTLSRIGFAVIIVGLLLKSTLTSDILAAFFFLLASLSDFYDGYLAKKSGKISDFGKMMDPIADKIMMLSIFSVLAHMEMIAWWMVIVIALREVLVTVDRLWVMKEGRVVAAEKSGKIKTFFQMATVCVILIYLILEQAASQISWFYGIQEFYLNTILGLMLITVLLTITSGIAYFRSKIRKISS